MRPNRLMGANTLIHRLDVRGRFDLIVMDWNTAGR